MLLKSVLMTAHSEFYHRHPIHHDFLASPLLEALLLIFHEFRGARSLIRFGASLMDLSFVTVLQILELVLRSDLGVTVIRWIFSLWKGGVQAWILVNFSRWLIGSSLLSIDSHYFLVRTCRWLISTYDKDVWRLRFNHERRLTLCLIRPLNGVYRAVVLIRYLNWVKRVLLRRHGLFITFDGWKKALFDRPARLIH